MAGQGLNAGIGDVKALVDALDRAAQAGKGAFLAWKGALRRWYK